MIKEVIFDFDNTLNDWDNIQPEAEVYIANKICAKHRLKPREFLIYLNKIREKYYMHRSPKIAYNRAFWFRQVFKHFKIKENVNKVVEDYWQEGLRRVKRFPKVKMVLKSLKSKYKIAMLTDSDGQRKYKIARVKKVGIYDYFDLIVPTDDVGLNKPHIECFRYVARKLGVKPSECVMIGDHPEVDLKSAKQLGMTTIWTQQAFRRDVKFPYVDFEVDRIEEVLPIMCQINRFLLKSSKK